MHVPIIQQILNAFRSPMKRLKSVHDVQCIQVKCGLREQIWCSMFKIDRCSMYPGSLPLIFNGNLPGNEKLFNVRRCSMYTGVQFGRFHCTILPKYMPNSARSFCRVCTNTIVDTLFKHFSRLNIQRLKLILTTLLYYIKYKNSYTCGDVKSLR